MNTALRLQKLRDSLAQEEMDAFLISSAENRRYLSEFTGSAGYLLISQTDAVLATDFRYVEQAGQQSPLFRVERVSRVMGWFVKLASELGVNAIGFESQHMTVGTHAAFQKAIDEGDKATRPALVEASDFVDKIRAAKYEGEMDLLTRAVQITDQAIEQVTPTIIAGMTERAWPGSWKRRCASTGPRAWPSTSSWGPGLTARFRTMVPTTP